MAVSGMDMKDANTLSGQKATLSSGGKRLKRIFPEIGGRQLRDMGWNVIIVWECELRSPKRQETLERLEKELYQLLKKEQLWNTGK